MSVPEAAPLTFAVDADQLHDPSFDREIEAAAAALREDRSLHLLVVGHADEDNTDAYNQALSRRRAEHVQGRILALLADDPHAAERVDTQARGEWDASEQGSDETAKAQNRRVMLRFYYPRRCEPSFDAAFLACEWGRLPEPAPPEPAPEPTPELATVTPPVTPPAPKPISARTRHPFRGPYVFALGGYAISSAEDLRQHVRYGGGAGYIWGIGQDFRLAAGLQVDHLVDVGFVFPQPDSCRPFCDRIDRSRVRLVPELRMGGARGGVWGWIRLSAGLLLQHHEAVLTQSFDATTGETTVTTVEAERWSPAAVLGIGPGVAIALTGHLFLLFDATVAYSTGAAGGIRSGGSGIYDAGAGLGWVF